MMSKFRFCMFLLVNAVAGLLSASGAALALKSVCPGDSVQAFQNITFDRCNALVSLNINGERNARIATWSMHNCTQNATVLEDYKERVFLNQTGAISIHNIDRFDQGKYVAISHTDTLPMIYEVEIYLMVAPTKDCKPKIVQLENSLFASLNASNCGRPVATPYWKDNGDVSRTNQAKLKLASGKEAGTYHACIDGPALSCVRNGAPQDYCSSITINGRTYPDTTLVTQNTKQEAEEVMMQFLGRIYAMIILILVIVGIVVITAVAYKYRTYACCPSTRNLNRRQLWTKHFARLTWDEIMELLSREQEQGLDTYYGNLNRRQLWTKHFGK